jgi:hypothetical protein
LETVTHAADYYFVHAGETRAGLGCYEQPRKDRGPKPLSTFQSRIINYYTVEGMVYSGGDHVTAGSDVCSQVSATKVRSFEERTEVCAPRVTQGRTLVYIE